MTATKRSRFKSVITVAGVVVAIALVAASFYPLWETNARYCFHCGVRSVTCHVLGLKVWSMNPTRGAYPDGLGIPAHQHRMIVSNSNRLWSFRGQEFMDEFGWTGSGSRAALMDGIANHPDREEEIIADYLRLDPDNREAVRRFVDENKIRKARP